MITCIVGATGSGKTWLATRLMRKDWIKGDTIFSNYPLSYDDKRTRIKKWESLSEIYGIKNGIIAIDEGQKLFHARRWDSLPMTFIDKITQHRKHKVDIVTTTQDIYQIDIQVRRNIHKLYSCHNLFRFPGDERVKPILQIIKVYRSKRIVTANPDYITWEKVGWPKLHFISRIWTREYYDTYADIGMQRTILKIYCTNGVWSGKLYNKELITKRLKF